MSGDQWGDCDRCGKVLGPPDSWEDDALCKCPPKPEPDKAARLKDLRVQVAIAIAGGDASAEGPFGPSGWICDTADKLVAEMDKRWDL